MVVPRSLAAIPTSLKDSRSSILILTDMVSAIIAYLCGVMIEFLKDVAYLWMEFPITTLVLTIAAVFCAYFIYCSVDILFHDPLQKRRDSGRS